MTGASMTIVSDPAFLSYANTCLLTVITIGGGLMYRRLGVISEHLTTMNGRVGRLEEWRTGHEAWARDMIERNDREHVQLQAHLERTHP